MKGNADMRRGEERGGSGDLRGNVVEYVAAEINTTL